MCVCVLFLCVECVCKEVGDFSGGLFYALQQKHREGVNVLEIFNVPEKVDQVIIFSMLKYLDGIDEVG